jgi:hypothetical protein
MKNFILSGIVMFMVTVFSVFVYADSNEITKLADYKKVQVQFTKATVLKLSQFVRDTGRRGGETKNPNYRLLHESDKLTFDSADAKLACTVYQKTMLSNRVKTYAEESVKFEKMITDKEALVLSPDTTWTITRVSPNDLGVLLWLQAEKKTLQIDCEKRNTDGKEIAMLPIDVLKTLSANEAKFTKDGKELQSPDVKSVESKSEMSTETTPSSTPTSEPEAP